MIIVNSHTILDFIPGALSGSGNIGRYGNTIIDIFSPPRCLLCDGYPDRDQSRFCVSCSEELAEARNDPACPTCAASVAPYEVYDGRCRVCRHRRLRIKGTVRAGAYRGRLGHALRQYKYREKEGLGPVLGGWLADAVAAAAWRWRVEALVAVPTHWRHRIGRPLYAAETIARQVARRTGLRTLSLLRRVRAGPHQIGLDYAERKRNVRGAFAIRRGVRLNGARVLLVDDVKTTGATIEECARILKTGGAAEVYAAVAVTAQWSGPASPLPSDL